LTIVILPSFFLNLLYVSKFDLGGVDIDNKMVFCKQIMINEKMQMKDIPGILARSFEFSVMRVRNREEQDIIKKITGIDKFKEFVNTKEDVRKGPIQLKPICLIAGYMYNVFDKKDL
jgi:hypothetical protein